MNGFKNWWDSTAIRAGLIGILIVAANIFGLSVTEGEIAEVVTQMSTLAMFVWGIYGRWKAEDKIA